MIGKNGMRGLGAKRRLTWIFPVLGVIVAACRAGAGPTAPASPAGPHPEDPAVARAFLRRSGERIVDGAGREVRLRGVAFGNQVWTRNPLPTRHHGEADFARVRAMGMNAVRFYLYYGTLEDDARPFVYKDAGWQWLDSNVAWARRHGVYLVLNMHVPPGGFQSQGDGRALWEVPANQDRLVALWRAIAARYAGEPVIAGYDLLNEPGVTASRGQWQALAARIDSAIREVDARHIVIVERTNSVAKRWDNDGEMNFFLLPDANVVYTFHFYEPFDYTHQLASWAKQGEGGPYPDRTRIARGPDTKWLGLATFDSPRLAPGDSEWTHVESPRLTARDPRAVIGHVSLVARAVGAGRAVFDDVSVDELDEAGRHVGQVLRIDLGQLGGWYFWSANQSGHPGTAAEGHDGAGALTITGTTGDANLGSFQHEFAPRPDHSYAISGWMRGEQLPPGAVVQIRLDFLGSDAPVRARDKAFLAAQLDRYLAWGHAHGVPLFLGEFGLHRPCFDGRGGLTWVGDMLDLVDERHLSFSYHAYHEDAFGIYAGSGPVDPARANQPLIDLFTAKLRDSTGS